MLTASDIKQLKSIFLTKGEFKHEMAEQNALMLKTFVTLDEFKDEMSTKFDAVISEIKAMREDMAAMLYRQREHSDQLDNHEVRLGKLKTCPQPA
jgi:hypothetical protein